MDGLNKTDCGFARECRLPASACPACKVDRETSDLHKSIVCGAYTTDQILAMQQRKEATP